MVLERINREQMLLEVAQVVAKRGTCSRAQVGVVIARNGRIISTGYNGAPAGMPHCDHSNDPPNIGGCEVVEHAERNAIAYSARYGVALDGAQMFCTHAPCLSCAKSIINAGIESVGYITPYRLTEGLDLLRAAKIRVLPFLEYRVGG